MTDNTKMRVDMIDAAMVEMANIYPPLTRTECARLIDAAWQAAQSVPVVGEPVAWYWDEPNAKHAFLGSPSEAATAAASAKGFSPVFLFENPATSITQAELDAMHIQISGLQNTLKKTEQQLYKYQDDCDAKDARIVSQHRQIIEEMVRTEAVKQELERLRKDAERQS